MKRSLMVAAAMAAFVIPAAAPLSVLAQDRGDRRGAALQNGGEEERFNARAEARAQAPQRDREQRQENRQERREERRETREEARPQPPQNREQRQERREARPENRQEARTPEAARDPNQPLFRNRQDILDARAREDRQNNRQERREDRQENRQERRGDRQERRDDRPNAPPQVREERRENRQERREDRWDRRDDRRDNRFDQRQDRREDRFERRQDRREYREFRQRFNSDRWRSNWNRSHRSDWWRSDRRFRGYTGLRIGFYFAPGYGYYQVPRSYWGQRYHVGQYLPSIFWRYQLNDWRTYGLGYPPVGTQWVLVDNHIYLIDQYDGYIIEVIYDAWRW